MDSADKKPSSPDKTENEGIQQIPFRTHGKGWPHPSLDGEVGPAKGDHDERSQTDILTLGFGLAPAFPASDQWLWEFVAHYSGATVPDLHGVP
jgi:hypothetical protein